MKILVISPEGDGFSLALGLNREKGTEVKLYCKDKRFQYAMGGLVEKVPSYRPHLKWADLVLVDMVGLGKMAKELDRAKVPYLGANLVADALELDRAKQVQTLQKFGVKLPPTYSYSDPREARKTLAMWTPPGYVVKPSGNLNTAQTRVCKEPEEFEWALDQFSADQELVVQKIVQGVEVSTEGWFDGKEWVHFNHTFEEKRFLSGDLGQHVGCMGNVVVEGRGSSALCRELQKLTPFLTKAGYRGPIDLNSIVTEDGPHALELTPRFGYDAIEALWRMMEGGLSEFLLNLAKGEGKPALLFDSFGTAVRLSLPPYPMAEPQGYQRDRPVVVKGMENHILWSDAYQEDNKLYWAAGDGVLAKAVGSGATLESSITEAYKAARSVVCPDLQFRTDIGSRVEDDLAQLESLGVI